MKYILSHDFGTSSAKSALFAEDGNMISCCSYDYPTYRSNGCCVEQDPEDWWKAFCTNNRKLLEEIDKTQIACVVFDGTIPDVLLVDRDLKPLHRALIWQDNRAGAEAEEFRARVPDSLHEGRGALGPARGAMMLMWLRKNKPEIYKNAYKVVISNSLFVIARLSGKVVSDYELAFGTAMLKTDYSGWQDEILDILGFERDLLPELHCRTDVIGEVRECVAEECGLLPGTKIVVGADDGGCNLLGCGVYRPGDGVLSCGTSGGAGGFDRFGHHTKIRGTQAAGASLEWARKIFCCEDQIEADKRGIDVYTVINEKIEQSPVGANGVMFHPYLAGERGMRNNPDARGSFTGLNISTTREDILRAVAEGIAFNISLSVDKARTMGCTFKKSPFIGGMSNGSATRQILADMINAELIIPKNPGYSACRGAAVLGGVGVGLFDDLGACEKFMQVAAVVRPDAKAHAKYEKLKPLFEEVYHSQEPYYARFKRTEE